MSPKAVDPTKYKLHVVSFSVVREGSERHVGTRPGKPILSDPQNVAALARQIIADDAKEHFWALLLDSPWRLGADGIRPASRPGAPRAYGPSSGVSWFLLGTSW